SEERRVGKECRKGRVAGRSDMAAKEKSTFDLCRFWRSISPKKSDDSPEKNPVGTPSRPNAMDVLKTEPPAKGTKAASPFTLSRGSMSIKASPQQSIIFPPLFRF